MAIRKRYIGSAKLQERQYEVFVEGVNISNVSAQRDKDLPFQIRTLADELLDDFRLSYDDIDAFVVSNSMGGLFGIPEFMRYVFPTAFGSHKVMYEVSCDESAGLCAVVRGYKLIKSGIFSRVCVISGMHINLKNIEELKNVIFSDILSDMGNIARDFKAKEKDADAKIDSLFEQYYKNALKNRHLNKKELKRTKFDPSDFPQMKNSVGVCILANSYSARVKEMRVSYADEFTVNSQNIYSTISDLVDHIWEQIGEKDNIDLIEISSINPVLDAILLKNIPVKDVILNLSGGAYFSNSPPVSSFLAFSYLYEYLKDLGKKAGLAFSVATRSLDHFSVIQLINESKAKKRRSS